MRIFFFAGNLLNPMGLVAKGPLSLLSLVCDLTTYPPSMPYNSWTEAENELMEMSTYSSTTLPFVLCVQLRARPQYFGFRSSQHMFFKYNFITSFVW